MLFYSRRLRFESLEDRSLLANADIIFLFDESLSGTENQTEQWIRALVTGDANGDGDTNDPNDTISLRQRLSSLGISSVRFGLVGFGEVSDNGTPSNPNDDFYRHAHSQLFEPGNDQSLFGDPSQMRSQ